MIAYLNGQFLERSAVSIAPDDRGFLFADGLYEVIRSYEGTLFRWEDHWARLANGLHALRLPPIEPHALKNAAQHLLVENQLLRGDALLYFQITRGSAPRAHRFPPEGTPPTVYMDSKPFQPALETQARGGSALLVPDQRWARCDLKTVGLLPNCLAAQRAGEEGALEALLVRDGAVLEGSRSNVFFVRNDTLWTAPLTNYILPGVTRKVVLELAGDLGIAVSELPCFEDEWAGWDECFITGTTVEITPIVAINRQPVGKGKPGPLTQRLQQEFRRRLTV